MVILRVPEMGDRPNMIDCKCLGWDVDMECNEVSPIFIFPEATYGSLKQFLDSPKNRTLPLEER